MKTIIEEIQSEADRLQWDALYSSKGHFNAAMVWNCVHYVLGATAVGLAAFASNEFTADSPKLGMYLASASAAVAAVITFLKPSDKSHPHQLSGMKFGGIKRRARMFAQLTCQMETDESVLNRDLGALAMEYQDLQEQAPAIPPIAYWLTRLGVRRGEHLYNEPSERECK